MNKSIFRKTWMKISPKTYVKYAYKKHFGEKPNLEEPQNFNEKILWIIFNWQNPLIVRCTDKYRMREYVKEVGLESILPKLYGAWESVESVDWNNLPETFVMKCNHGCEMNIICNDKSKLDIKVEEAKLNKWMQTRYGCDKFYEPHYLYIKPIIFAEEYIKTADGKLPIDYKIYCFNGKPELILACIERDIEVKFEFYDLEWNVLDIGAEKNGQKARKPKSLSKMIEYAKQLSQPFPFVRVDFYDRDGEPILGELTFTPFYGMARYYSKKGNLWLGSKLQLPEKYSGHFK